MRMQEKYSRVNKIVFQLIEKGMVPHMTHIIPVPNDSIVDRIRNI
uniref:Uncharacterized protein n=2 Tax=Rhizophora mucronata TaxID=61149 RepID=A0A2P2IX06_RHIMU